MKTSNWILIIAALTCSFGANAQNNQQAAEVPGDNFSLEGALELFKKSGSPEEFERMLNSPDSKVNNLDLNDDNNIDYIRVIDRNEGNIHAFILQDVISSTENQDVAVIELQKLEDGRATLQITGDADIYGIETIIEPSDEVRVNAGTSTARVVTNVWTWPVVQYVYATYYNPWMSPWSWAYYPIWWRPWVPVAFTVYGPWWRPFRPYYSFCYSHRIGYMPTFYGSYRCSSRYVYNTYHVQVNNYRTHYASNGGGHRGRDYNGDNHYRGYAGRTDSDFGHRGNSHDRSGWNSNDRGRVDSGNSHRGFQGGQDRHDFQGGRQNQSTFSSHDRNSFSHSSSSSFNDNGRGQTRSFSHSNWQSSSTSPNGRSHFGGSNSGGSRNGFSGGSLNGGSGGSHFSGGSRSSGFSGGSSFSGGGRSGGGTSGGGHFGGGHSGGGHSGGGSHGRGR